MKDLLTTFCLLSLLLSSGCGKSDYEYNNTETGKIAPEQLEGFRGIKWGADLASDPNMILEDTDELVRGVTCYTRKNDKLSIGDCKLEYLHYCCYEGKFASVRFVSYDFSGLKEIIEQTYAELKSVKDQSGKQVGLWIRNISEQGHYVLHLRAQNVMGESLFEISDWNLGSSLRNREFEIQREKETKTVEDAKKDF